MDSFKLNNGIDIPAIGLGVWHMRDHDECVNAVVAALKMGYRHIDTAQIYGNEEFVGEGVAKSGVDRTDIFITTKIWNENYWWDDLIPSYDESLKKLQTDYADLLLLHFPVTETRSAAWRRMEDLYTQKRVRSIGVSNYTVRHLQELLETCIVKPTVNQVELSIYLQQPELLAFCKENDIVVEAYSPLIHGYRLDNPVVAEIAKKHHATQAQIMIAWCVAAGTLPLPKSTHADRLKENLEALDIHLDSSDIAKLKPLDENFRTAWDPTNVP